MDKNSNLELLYNPSLILLIDKPTEKDLFNVIYSDNLKLSVIRDLPDDSITPRVATYALCLTKTWGIEELKLWFNKFFPHVLSKDYVKVFKSILSGLVGSTEDIDLFIDLFGQVENPPKDLVDFYIGEANKHNKLFGTFQTSFTSNGEWVDKYELNSYGLTENLTGKLDTHQQNIILNSILNVCSVDYYCTNIRDNDYLLLKHFLTDDDIFNKAKEKLDDLANNNDKVDKIREKDLADDICKNHWWNKIF